MTRAHVRPITGAARSAAVVLALAALSSAWLVPRILRRGEPASAAPPAISSGPSNRAAVAGSTADPVARALGAAREERIDVRADRPEPVLERAASPPLHELVRVRGQLRLAGLPIEGFDLSFRSLEATPAQIQAAWDFTDENGRYEVRLPPARYSLGSDDQTGWSVEFRVPGDQAEHALDIDLPMATFGCAR
jgi:hypothetical protein